ncbi:MAG: hypothetical protein IT384_34320 [Deltaproteobacteria bacterium]|nr:hypothetical protein [Deltaproteobacteria bacterium]
MRLRVGPLGCVLLTFACGPRVREVPCPTGSRLSDGVCRVVCVDDTQCLTNERCEGVCLEGPRTRSDAGGADAAQGPRDAELGPDRAAAHDAGSPAPDASVADAVPGPDDGGVVTNDAGIPPSDGGVVAPDAVVNADATPNPIDGGPPVPDGGPRPDAGGYVVAIVTSAGITVNAYGGPGVVTPIRTYELTAAEDEPVWLGPQLLAFASNEPSLGHHVFVEDIVAGTHVGDLSGRDPDYSRPNDTLLAVDPVDGCFETDPPRSFPCNAQFPIPQRPRWDPSGALRFTYLLGDALQLAVVAQPPAPVVSEVVTYVWEPAGGSITAVRTSAGGSCAVQRLAISSNPSVPPEDLITGVDCASARLAWSLDGQQLVLGQDSPPAIYLFARDQLDGSPLATRAPLITLPGPPSDLEITYDGRFLVYTSRASGGPPSLTLQALASSANQTFFIPAGPAVFSLQIP